MSVEHRPPEPDPETDADEPRLELSCSDNETTDPTRSPDRSSPSGSRTADEPPVLERRIERTRLRLQVAALQRSLEASERRRQAVVDQYELVLDERAAGESPTESDGRDRPLPLRVLDRLRR